MAKLSTAELSPADVLLITGVGDISESIATLDGGAYSHVALYVGDGCAIEAKLPRVKTKPLAEVLSGIRRADVFTPRGSNLEQRNEVVAAARHYEARGYSGSALLLSFSLLALVGSTHPGFQDASAKILNWILEATEFRSPTAAAELTCAELVARAYADAGVPLATMHPDDRRRNLDAFQQALRGAWAYRHSGLFRGVLPSALLHALPSGSEAHHESISSEWISAIQRGLAPDASPEELRAACALLSVHLKGADLLYQAGALPAAAQPVPARATWQPDQVNDLAGAAEAFAIELGANWHASLTTPRMIAESTGLAQIGELFP